MSNLIVIGHSKIILKSELFIFMSLVNYRDILKGLLCLHPSRLSAYLQQASKELRDDKDIVWAAVTNYPHALEFASNRLKDDKELVLEVACSDALAIQFASYKLRDSYQIVIPVLKSIRCNYHPTSDILEFASERLKNDSETIALSLKIEDALIFAKFGRRSDH